MNGFTFYLSYIEGVEGLPEKQRAAWCLAIVDYVFSDVEPELTGELKRHFVHVRPLLNKSKNRSIAGSITPSQSDNEESSNDGQKKIKTKSKENQNTDKKEAIDLSLSSNSSSIGRGGAGGKGKPASAEEVRAYCVEKSYNVDAERFFDFYES